MSEVEEPDSPAGPGEAREPAPDGDGGEVDLEEPDPEEFDLDEPGEFDLEQSDHRGAESAETEAEPGPQEEPGPDEEPGPAAGPQAEDDEGPRRRARRERAERRAAQQRAMGIEQARREAVRRARGHDAPPAGRPGDRAVRGLRTLLWAVVLAVASVALGLILYFTPVMSARSIVVVGTGVVTREEVVDVAAIRPGTPLLQVDTDAVAERVAGIRRVASARVQREYPSSVRITIVERIPIVVKDFPDGPHLFDRDGVDFATAPPPPGLAYIEVDNPGPADPPTVAALDVMTALRPEVVAQVSRIAAPSASSITLTLTDGRTVVWGTDERTAEKAEKLAALLTQPGRVYDVSSPDLPTVK
jgi:cell division protein FtsQ